MSRLVTILAAGREECEPVSAAIAGEAVAMAKALGCGPSSLKVETFGRRPSTVARPMFLCPLCGAASVALSDKTTPVVCDECFRKREDANADKRRADIADGWAASERVRFLSRSGSCSPGPTCHPEKVAPGPHRYQPCFFCGSTIQAWDSGSHNGRGRSCRNCGAPLQRLSARRRRPDMWRRDATIPRKQ